MIILISISARTDENLGTIFKGFEVGDYWVGDLTNGILQVADEEIKKTVDQGLKDLISLLDEKALDQNFITAAKILREKGFKVALLTNNGWLNKEKTESVILDDLSLFDVVVESCRVKMRKPNADIYLHTAELLGLTPQECVFIDDLDINVEGAKKIGMAGVQVFCGESDAAIQELEKIVGISLKP